MTRFPPLVAITTRRIGVAALTDYPENLHSLQMDAVVSSYAQAVTGAGGVPILLPRWSPIEALVSRIDALILSGGEDVTPELYGAEPGPHSTALDPDRDRFELELIEQAMEHGVPILAICRGTQILNVALGGTLIAHLDEVAGFSHAMGTEAPHVRRHGVSVDPDSRLARALGVQPGDTGHVLVNSFHHQAVDRPGESLCVVARADDGTVEAVEGRSAAVIGVQWHPELHEGVDPIFEWLVQAARNYQENRRKGIIDADRA